MLELGAVYLDASTRIAEQRLGHGLDYASLARAGRPQEQQVPDRPSCRVQASQKRLVDFGNLLDCRILAYNLVPQCGFEFPRIVAAPRGIQGCVQSDFHNAYHSHVVSAGQRPGRVIDMESAPLHRFLGVAADGPSADATRYFHLKSWMRQSTEGGSIRSQRFERIKLTFGHSGC